MDIAKLEVKLAKARQEYDAAQKTLSRVFKLYEKAVQDKLLAAPMGIEEALRVHLDGHVENSVGYHALQALSWQGTLHARGVYFAGCHWPRTDQYQIHVALNHQWGETKLIEAAEVIEAVLPFVKPGALGNFNWGKPVEPSERDGWKTFQIFASEHTLSVREDGSWVIYTERYKYSGNGITFETKAPKNSVQARRAVLMEVLGYIRDRHYYEGGPRNDDYDY